MCSLFANDIWNTKRWTVFDILFPGNNWTSCGLPSILLIGLGMKWILCLCMHILSLPWENHSLLKWVCSAFCTGKRHLSLHCPLQSCRNNQFSRSSSWTLCSQQDRLLILWKVIIESIRPLIMTLFWKHTLLLCHLHKWLEMLSMTSWCVLSLEGAMLKLCSSWGRDFLAFLTVPPVPQAADCFRAVKNLWSWGFLLLWLGFGFFGLGLFRGFFWFGFFWLLLWGFLALFCLFVFCLEESSRIFERSF